MRLLTRLSVLATAVAFPVAAFAGGMPQWPAPTVTPPAITPPVCNQPAPRAPAPAPVCRKTAPAPQSHTHGLPAIAPHNHNIAPARAQVRSGGHSNHHAGAGHHAPARHITLINSHAHNATASNHHGVRVIRPAANDVSDFAAMLAYRQNADRLNLNQRQSESAMRHKASMAKVALQREALEQASRQSARYSYRPSYGQRYFSNNYTPYRYGRRGYGGHHHGSHDSSTDSSTGGAGSVAPSVITAPARPMGRLLPRANVAMAGKTGSAHH
ncbi:MAG: hypothetical protein V3U82_03180 [Robiginitomaculum sp.]